MTMTNQALMIHLPNYETWVRLGCKYNIALAILPYKLQPTFMEIFYT